MNCVLKDLNFSFYESFIIINCEIDKVYNFIISVIKTVFLSKTSDNDNTECGLIQCELKIVVLSLVGEYFMLFLKLKFHELEIVVFTFI